MGIIVMLKKLVEPFNNFERIPLHAGKTLAKESPIDCQQWQMCLIGFFQSYLTRYTRVPPRRVSVRARECAMGSGVQQ